MISDKIGVMEKELILKIQQGNQEAFTFLVKKYLQKVYRCAYSVVRNVDDASDIAQEAFLRAYRSIHSFDVEKPIYPWLYRITKNLSLNYISRRKCRDCSTEEELPDTGNNPEVLALRKEAQNGVERAIEKLPDIHREIIILKHIQNCSYQEIAEILDIPVGTVMSRLYNARMKLKEILNEQEVRNV